MWSRYGVTNDQIRSMWAAELKQKIRLAFRYEVEDDKKAHRLLSWVNYHILAVNSSQAMPPYINFLRGYEFTDEVKMSVEETQQESARMISDINQVVNDRLNAHGQRELTPEEIERLISERRRFQDPGRGGGDRRQSGTPISGVPSDGSQHGKLDPAELRGD